MANDNINVWSAILFTIALGLFVYFSIIHIESLTWLAPIAMLGFPFIVYPLCDIAGKIIQDFIDKIK